jgi:hypothetical protein
MLLSCSDSLFESADRGTEEHGVTGTLYQEANEYGDCCPARAVARHERVRTQDRGECYQQRHRKLRAETARGGNRVALERNDVIDAGNSGELDQQARVRGILGAKYQVQKRLSKERRTD